MRGVCASAGLITRYFYEQFESREALLFAIIDEVRVQLLEAMLVAGIGESGGDLRDKLRAALTAFLNIVAEDPHLHRIVSGDVTGVPGLLEHRMQLLDMIVASIIEQAPSVLGARLPEPAILRRGAVFMVGGVNQIIAEWLRNPSNPPTPRRSRNWPAPAPACASRSFRTPSSGSRRPPAPRLYCARHAEPP